MACFCPRAGLHHEFVPFLSVFTPRALLTKSKLRFVYKNMPAYSILREAKVLSPIMVEIDQSRHCNYTLMLLVNVVFLTLSHMIVSDTNACFHMAIWLVLVKQKRGTVTC